MIRNLLVGVFGFLLGMLVTLFVLATMGIEQRISVLEHHMNALGQFLLGGH